MELERYYKITQNKLKKIKNLEIEVLPNSIKIDKLIIAYECHYPGHCKLCEFDEEKIYEEEIRMCYGFESVEIIKGKGLRLLNGEDLKVKNFKKITYLSLNFEESKNTIEIARNNKKLEKFLEEELIKRLDLEVKKIENQKYNIPGKPVIFVSKENVKEIEIQNSLNFFTSVFLSKIKERVYTF